MGKILRFKHPTVLTLTYYHDNELQGTEKAGVTNHLKRCGRCSLRVKEIAGVDALVRRFARRTRRKSP